MDFEQYMSTRNFGLIINFLSLNLLNSNLDKQGTMKMSLRDGFKKRKKKLMEFSIKGPDPASQHPYTQFFYKHSFYKHH